MAVDSPVVELPVDLKVPDVCVELIKGDAGRVLPAELFLRPFKEFPQIGRIVRDGAFREIAEGKDIDMFLDKRAVVFVQSEPPVKI